MAERKQVQRAARALRQHMHDVSESRDAKPQYGVVRDLDPLKVELTHGSTVLDEDDLTESQWVRRYTRDHGFTVGDTVIVVPVDGDWLITDVVTDLAIEKEAAVSSPSGGATVDAEARAAIDGVLNVLRAAGLME